MKFGCLDFSIVTILLPPEPSDKNLITVLASSKTWVSYEAKGSEKVIANNCFFSFFLFFGGGCRLVSSLGHVTAYASSPQCILSLR